MMQQKNRDKCSYAWYLCNSSQIAPLIQDFRSNNQRQGGFFTTLFRGIWLIKSGGQ